MALEIQNICKKYDNHDALKNISFSLKKGDIVVYESTVYPGVTEEICIPILEEKSSLQLGVDFKVGYSPERINPGDKKNDSFMVLIFQCSKAERLF